MRKLIIILSLFLPLLITSCSKDEPSRGLLRYNGHIVFERFHFDVSGTDATIVEYTGNEATVTVPTTIDDYVDNEPVTYTVKHIGNRAFENKPLNHITLPGTLKTIGDQAFINCANLSEIQLPSSLTSIGFEAFNNCTSLSEIQLPSSLTSIGSRAFQNTAIREVTIPSGTLGDNVFGNTKLEKVVLGSGVKNIPAREFSSDNLGGSTLTSVTFPSDLLSIGEMAFAGNRLTELNIPSVKTIGNSAFQDSYYLENVSLPATLNELGNAAFKNCVRLATIQLPSSLASIGNEAFYNTAIREITIPSGTLGSNVFGNTQLERVVIGSGVRSIPDGEFSSANLGGSTLTSVTFSGNLLSIGAEAFAGSSITQLSIPSVTTIGVSAFTECKKLTTVSLGDGIERISATAFKDCSQLRNMSISPTLNEIGDYAFQGTAIEEFTLTTTNLGTQIFYQCPLKTLHIGANIVAIPDNFRERLVSYITNTLQTITFSEGLVTIGNHAFDELTHVTEVDIPSTVTTIGEKAFYNMDFNKITIGSSVSYIGDEAFKTNFNHLKSFTFKGKNPPVISATNGRCPVGPYCNFYVPQESLEAYTQVLQSAFIIYSYNTIIGY